MTIKTYKTVPITKITKQFLAGEEWLKLVEEHKPHMIICEEYSRMRPFLEIEYLPDGKISVICTGWADKTPMIQPLSWLYENFKHAGYSSFTFNTKPDANENTIEGDPATAHS